MEQSNIYFMFNVQELEKQFNKRILSTAIYIREHVKQYKNAINISKQQYEKQQNL